MKVIIIKGKPNFMPNINPYEMIVLGVFGGRIFKVKSDLPKNMMVPIERNDIPYQRYRNITYDGLINCYDQGKRNLQVNNNHALWRKTFYKWYCNFYYGKLRKPHLDDIMIDKWQAFKDTWSIDYHRATKDGDRQSALQRLLEIGVHITK
jgi:hypothetical protein